MGKGHPESRWPDQTESTRCREGQTQAFERQEEMRLKKGSLYWVRVDDHNEAEPKKTHGDPRYVLNVVGRYAGQKGRYLIFYTWWGDDLTDKANITQANVLKKAVIEVKELK